MDVLLQQIFNGVALGSVYALFGVGFGLMLATLGVLNAAHGTYATWGALVTLILVNDVGLSFWPAAAIGVVAAGVLSTVVDLVAFQPLRRRGDDLLPALITSIGIWIFLLAAARIYTEARTSRFDPERSPSGAIDVAGATLPWSQILSVLALVVAGGTMLWLLHYTRVGAAMRAVGHSPKAAAIGGVNPLFIVMVTTFLAGAMAGTAGVATGLVTSTVSFLLGESLLLKGFAAVIIGGFGDVRGTIVAGLLIGVAEVMTAQYISGTLRDALTFGLLLGFLVLRPRGLFGKSTMTVRA